jgi:lipoprotein-anchoring transpeptidase ErfK/SrfK
MSRLFFVLLLSALVIIVLSTFIPTAAFASDHPALFDQQRTSANAPPLPFVRPQVTPLLLHNLHADFELPTATEKWIEVHLGEQRIITYEGSRSVRSFIVSTGLPRTPTVTGQFWIRMKVRSQTMSGPGYYLPNVEWVQYFYGDYAFHGTYWHDNFGQPMSRGCINMTNEDAKWLFDWAGPVFDHDGSTWQRPSAENPGTLVIVHE